MIEKYLKKDTFLEKKGRKLIDNLTLNDTVGSV